MYVTAESVVAHLTNFTTNLKIVCDGFWMQDESCSSSRGTA
jgi:hypothetical protein